MKDIAYKFIRFAHTDVSLKEFTKVTNTPKSFDYEMSASDLNELSNFGKSVYKIKEKATVVYGYSTDKFGRKVANSIMEGYATEINGLPYADVAKTFKEYPQYTSKMYFEGIGKHFSESDWNLKYSGYFN